jgi:hypothetical protein
MYASNNECGGQASESVTVNPASNPLNCLSLPSGEPFESVYVKPDDADPIYTVYLYSDPQCIHQIFAETVLIGHCFNPTPVFAVWIDLAVS